MEANYNNIINKMNNIDVYNYGKNRNYINGNVTKLSPYISRGLISTKQVLNSLIKRDINLVKIEKFIQELAWRDYWQTVWIHKDVNKEIKCEQHNVTNFKIPTAILEAKTGILAIDDGIKQLYSQGYIHNHLRMYISSIICNIANCHWQIPAKWLYYHLIDGDWASNNLSWQWVCGANSSKKYYANQDNINKFCFTNQKNTFLDFEYSQLIKNKIPELLSDTKLPLLNTQLPLSGEIIVNNTKPILLFNYYNLDPLWRNDLNANKILLIEPSIFLKHPISKNNMHFFTRLSKNIEDIQIYVGEFEDFIKKLKGNKLYYKEHPLNTHYQGTCDNRDWMFSTQKYFPSFFQFWKNYKTELNL